MVTAGARGGVAKKQKSGKTIVVLAQCWPGASEKPVRVREDEILSAAGRIAASRRKTAGGGPPLVEIRCRYCRRAIIGAHNIVQHERACPRNPNVNP